MKRLAISILLIFLALIIHAQDETIIPDKEKTNSDNELVYTAGISIVPFARWQFLNSYGLTNLSYRLDKTRSTSYEADFRYKIFSFGASASTNDNIIGKLDSILGYTYPFERGGRIIFAAGYDVIRGLIAGPSYESPDKNTMRLEGDAKLFFRHGVIFRVYGSW